MPLPIELNHVLGRRMLTLAYRDVNAPVVIGRGRDCDVQIPSVSVGLRHCMLFVHEGQWLLQETPGNAVTVNGTPIAGPVAVNIGDVIGVGPGPKAPTLQIDPAAAAAGKTGPAGEATPEGLPPAAAPAVAASAMKTIRPPRPTPIAGDAPPQLSPLKRRPAVMPLAEPEPQYATESVLESESVPYSHDEAAAEAEVPVDDSGPPADDAIDFGVPAAAATSRPAYRRRVKAHNGNALPMIGLFIVVLVGLSGLIFWAWKRKQANAASVAVVQTQSVAITPTTAPAAHSSGADTVTGLHGTHSIFDVPDQRAKPPAIPTPAPPPVPPDTGNPAVQAPPATPPDQATTNPADPTDATAGDTSEAWLDVLTAHDSSDQANAIMRFDSYRDENPNKHTKELEKFVNEAMEHLWWKRIYDLFQDRADLDAKITKQKQDMAQQPDDNFKKQMRADLADMQAQRTAEDQELTTKYGYTLPTEPPIDDQDALAQLDAQRDAQHFETWKKNTLQWIREHNGHPPWTEE